MNLLDRLPRDAVQSLPRALLPALREAAGPQWREVDLHAAPAREQRLNALARALQAPPGFGGNLDALYDLLTDLPDGSVLWLAGYAEGPDDAPLLEVFRDAARQQAEAGRSLRVLY